MYPGSVNTFKTIGQASGKRLFCVWGHPSRHSLCISMFPWYWTGPPGVSPARSRWYGFVQLLPMIPVRLRCNRREPRRFFVRASALFRGLASHSLGVFGFGATAAECIGFQALADLQDALQTPTKTRWQSVCDWLVWRRADCGSRDRETARRTSGLLSV